MLINFLESEKNIIDNFINFFSTDEAVIDELKTSLTILSVIQKGLAPLASHVTESKLGDRDITGEHLERMVALIGDKAVIFPSEELPQQPLEIVKLNVPKEAPEGIYERIEKYWDHVIKVYQTLTRAFDDYLDKFDSDVQRFHKNIAKGFQREAVYN